MSRQEAVRLRQQPEISSAAVGLEPCSPRTSALTFDSGAKARVENLRKAVFASVQAVNGRASPNLAKFQEKSGTRFESQEGEAEGHQAKAVEKVRMECDSLNATASEQRAAIDGWIDEQNTAVSTAVATPTKRTEAATKEQLRFIAASFEPVRMKLESACAAVAQELRADLETVSAQHRKNSAEVIASIADVNRRLDERVCPHLGRIDELLAEVQARVTRDAANANRPLNALSDRSDELRQLYGQLQEQEKALEKRMDGFVHEIHSEFLAHSSAIESWENKATSDSSRILGHYEAIQRETSSLKRIHHFTAQFEQYDHRFEEMVSYIQQHLRSSFRSIYASVANGKTNGDSINPPVRPRTNRTQCDFFAIDAAESGAKTDLSAILQPALDAHQQGA
jgi:hypothetical protein